MSLSLLPNEVLLQIIDSVAPLTIRCATYDERQASLCALCLASRRSRHIAQPLLRQIVWIKWEHRLQPITTSAVSMGWGHLTSEIAFEVLSYSFVPSLQLLAASFPQVLTFKLLSCFGGVDLSSITAFSSTFKLQSPLLSNADFPAESELSSLHLCCEVSGTQGVSLPNLQNLTLVGRQHETTLRSTLDPTVLPALKVLAFAKIPKKTLLALSRSPSTIKLFRQLDALILLMQAVTEDVVSNIRTILPKTLIDADSDCLAEYAKAVHYAYHLRARNYHYGWPGRERVPDGSPLRSFYLDVALRSSSNRRQVLDSFLLSCESRGVQVVHEERPEGHGVDSIISPEFSRRQREHKESRRGRLQGE